MIEVGILQGRLAPMPSLRGQAFPARTWRDEFAIARSLGFDAIEWLVTAEGLEENPLLSVRGLDEIRARSAETGVPVRSICADCFIPRPFVRVSDEARQDSSALLTRIVEQAARLGAAVVLVPILEGAAVRGDREAVELRGALAAPLALASAAGVGIGLETDMEAAAARALVAAAGDQALGVYYDTGNAAALGRDPASELLELLPVLVGVHAKDRVRGGASVPLGEGDADLARALGAVARAGCPAPLVLETPAGEDAVGSARANLAFVRAALERRIDRAVAP